MKIFNKKKTSTPVVPEPVAEKKEANAPKKDSYNVLRPWVSEKSTALREKNAYVFLVRGNAGKREIEKEIKARYDVSVEQVRTIQKMGKVKKYRARVNKRSDVKKAIVTLKKGDTIDII